MALAQTTACYELSPPGPRLLKVLPESGTNDTPTEVVIYGADFNPRLKADYNKRQGSLVSTAFSAKLGSHQLWNVGYLDSTRLSATVPVGLEPGMHDLIVVDPWGGWNVLGNAFFVGAAPTDGGAEGQPDGGGDLGEEGGVDLSVENDLAQDASADTGVDGAGSG